MSYSNSDSSFTQVIVIGAGFSGLTMACQLKRKLHCDDFVIYDRSNGFGGAWRVNTYPGCGVDIPAVFYSLSFMPNPDFSCFFPQQREILQYFDSVVDKYQLSRHFVGKTEWVGASWQETSKTWQVKLRNVCTRQVFVRECRVLISAVGALINPDTSSIPSAERFTGDIIHTARWDHSVPLKDKDVIVVGNGASATQVIPAIADDPRSITQFIRGAQFYLPGGNTMIGSSWRVAFRYLPGLLKLIRALTFLYLETATPQFRRSDTGERMRDRQFLVTRRYIMNNAPKEYWPLLLPAAEVGCKRRVFDHGGYIPCLKRENIHLTNDPIVAILEHSVITQSGTIHPADVIILGTGFSMTHFDTTIIGRHGQTRAEHWKARGGVEAFDTIAMSGFPNLFYVLGPNSGTGHTSTVYGIENYTDLIIRIIQPIIAGSASSVQAKLASEKRFNREVQEALRKTVYSNGCQSWFIDKKTGRNWVIYPWNSFRMWYRTHIAGLGDWEYEFYSRKADGSGLQLTRYYFMAVTMLLSVLAIYVLSSLRAEVVVKRLWVQGENISDTLFWGYP